MSDEMISFGAKLAQNAATQGERPAVSCGAETLTYGQLHRTSNRIARGLAALGVEAGDLVTVGLPNSVGFVEACHAIWKLGATPQPISFRLPKAELQAIVALADAPLVIAEFEHRIDRPVMKVAEIAAMSDDESDLPDVVPAVVVPGASISPALPSRCVPTRLPRVTPSRGRREPHVAGRATKVIVTMTDGRQYDARIIGSDPTSDVALLKIEGKNPVTTPVGAGAAGGTLLAAVGVAFAAMAKKGVA